MNNNTGLHPLHRVRRTVPTGRMRSPWRLGNHHTGRGSVITSLVLLACFLVGGTTTGQDEAQEQDQESTPPATATNESITHWEYFVEVDPRAAADAQCDFLLAPRVFSHARLDLADLRLYDDGGKEVPYALRIRREEHTTESLSADTFNQADGPNGSSVLTLDLGADTIEHNEVEVETPGGNFRRAITVEGSDDNATWSKLAESSLVRFDTPDGKLNGKTVQYDPSRFRYLRLRVQQDPNVDKQPVKIGTVKVQRKIDVEGEYVIREVTFGERQAVRENKFDSSQWIIDLGGDSIPVEEILVEIEDAEFARDVELEAGGRDLQDPFYQVAYREYESWRRRAGEEIKPMRIAFSEVQASRLRLTVIDQRNPPLKIKSINVKAAARQVVFKNDASLDKPLQLYFGNPEAGPTGYDYARNLPRRLTPAPTRLTIGELQQNPSFIPVPKPLSERFPWLIYVLLGSAVVLLALLIVNLTRAAIRNHDNQEATLQTSA